MCNSYKPTQASGLFDFTDVSLSFDSPLLLLTKQRLDLLAWDLMIETIFSPHQRQVTQLWDKKIFRIPFLILPL